MTAIEKIANTCIVTVDDPSALLRTVGTTVTFVGAVPPDADVSADIVAAVTCACIAAMTDDSLPPGGSENVRTCVTGTETISVKVMMAPTPLESVVVVGVTVFVGTDELEGVVVIALPVSTEIDVIDGENDDVGVMLTETIIENIEEGNVVEVSVGITV